MTVTRSATLIRVDELAQDLHRSPSDLLGLADELIGRAHRAGAASGMSAGIRQYARYAAATVTPLLADALRAAIAAEAQRRHLPGGRTEWVIPA
jgi:hypothetical protein